MRIFWYSYSIMISLGCLLLAHNFLFTKVHSLLSHFNSVQIFNVHMKPHDPWSCLAHGESGFWRYLLLPLAANLEIPANLWNHIPPQDLNRLRGRSVRHSLLEMPKNCPRCRHAGFLPSWTTRTDYKATTIRLKEHLKIENNCFTCFTEYPWQELVCLDMSTSWFSA